MYVVEGTFILGCHHIQISLIDKAPSTRRFDAFAVRLSSDGKSSRGCFAMASGIYQITNQVNGKRYIGSATNIQNRGAVHRWGLCYGRHCNRYLQAAFDKYGESAFIFEVLEYIDPESLIKREQYYVDTLNPEYNLCPVTGSPLGYRHTEETRRKMSKAHKGERSHLYGKHPSEETRRRNSEAHIGKVLSKETKRKISAALRGRTLSEDHRRKISKSLMGHQVSEESRMKMSIAHRKNKT